MKAFPRAEYCGACSNADFMQRDFGRGAINAIKDTTATVQSWVDSSKSENDSFFYSFYDSFDSNSCSDSNSSIMCQNDLGSESQLFRNQIHDSLGIVIMILQESDSQTFIQIQGWTIVQQSYSHALEQGSLVRPSSKGRDLFLSFDRRDMHPPL